MADEALNFMACLKQHHIYRVAAGYGAAIAVLIQIIARAFPYFGLAAAVSIVQEPSHLTLKGLINVAVNAASRKP